MWQALCVIRFIVAPLTSHHLQADLRSSLGDGGYIVFGVILFVWELLPTSLVVFFFRVRRPPQERVSLHANFGRTCESDVDLPNWLSTSNDLWSPNTSWHVWSLASFKLNLRRLILTHRMSAERCRHTEPCSLLQRVLLRQPPPVRQRRWPGMEHPAPKHFCKVQTNSCWTPLVTK